MFHLYRIPLTQQAQSSQLLPQPGRRNRPRHAYVTREVRALPRPMRWNLHVGATQSPGLCPLRTPSGGRCGPAVLSPDAACSYNNAATPTTPTTPATPATPPHQQTGLTQVYPKAPQVSTVCAIPVRAV